MLNQMYYSAKSRLGMRLMALAILVLGCVFFLAMSSSNVSGDDTISMSADVVFGPFGVVFSAFAFIGIIIVCFIASDLNNKLLFKQPTNYLMALTPVPAWKKMLGDIIPAMFLDLISIGIGILFIVIMSYNVTDGLDISDILSGEWLNRYSVFAMAFVVVGYGLFAAAGALWYAISDTILRNIPFRKVAATIVVVALIMAFSWVSIVMLPLGEIHRFGPLFIIHIAGPATWQLGLMILLMFAQAAALFVLAAHIMDRRV